MESEMIVGLDIGTTKIAAIVGRKNDLGKIEVLGYGRSESIGVRRGVITNIENTVQSRLTPVLGYGRLPRYRISVKSVTTSSE